MNRIILLVTGLTCVFVLTMSFALAASQPSTPAAARLNADNVERIQRHPVYGTAEILSGKFTVSMGATKAERALVLIARHSDAFQIAQPQNELKLLTERTDNLGLSHLRFQQVYNEVPVWGCQTIVHFRDDNTIYLVGGQTIPTPHINTVPDISNAAAKAVAISDVRDQYVGFELRPKSELVIYPNEGDPKLAQLVTVTSPTNGAVRWRVFVDAENGGILHSFNDIHFDGPDTGMGIDVTGNWDTFPIYNFGGSFQMVDATRVMFTPPASNLDGVIVTYDDFYHSGPISTDPNSDKIWNDNPDQKAEVSGHVYAGITYNYYLNTFSRDSYDDSGSTIIVNIHDPYYTNNAYWNGQAINFADGDGFNFLPFSGELDVVAHELTHGVTEYNGNGGLIYQFQSGALNESMSDFFGSMVDSADNQWLIGEDITLFSPGYLRSMKDPTLRNDPKHMNNYLYLSISNDNGGVHSNSGIPNHCAYRASDIHGLGRDKTEQIWYRTLTTYLTPSSGFYFWAGMIMQSAIDLYGYGSGEMAAMEAALGDVGLGTVYAQPQNASVGAAFGQVANQSIWLVNPGSSIGSVTVSPTVPSFPGLSIAPSSAVIADGDSAEFVVTLDATGLTQCDVGFVMDTLDFTAVGAYTTEIRVPLSVNVGYTAASVSSKTASTACVTLNPSNTTNITQFRRDGNDVLYDGSLLIGVKNGTDTTTYRHVFGTQSLAPVDTIGGNPSTGPLTFRISSDDGRIQGKATYSWSGNVDSCGFIVAEFMLYNLCDTPLTVLSGLFCDFDVNTSSTNQVYYDALDRLVYIRDQGDTRAAGIALLSGAPRNLRAINNPSLVWGGAFTDGVAYSEMAKTTDANGATDDDWSALLTFAEVQLGVGDTAEYAAAYVYSNIGSGGLTAIVEKAQAWWSGPPTCCVNRGNVDGLIGPAGPVDVADLTYLVAYLFQGGTVPPCEEEGNVDGIIGVAGPIDVADLTYLVAFLFQGGQAPPPC